MHNEMLMKKSPAGLTQPGRDMRATAQGGKTADLYSWSGVLCGRSLRAHNRSLRLARSQINLAHVPPHQGNQDNGQQHGQYADGGVHGSVQVFGVDVAQDFPRAASAAVDQPGDVVHEEHSGLRLGGGLRADQLGRQVPASDGRLNSVTDGGWKLVRPLTDSGCADPDGISGGRDGTAQELDGFRFAHAQILVHLALCVKCA